MCCACAVQAGQYPMRGTSQQNTGVVLKSVRPGSRLRSELRPSSPLHCCSSYSPPNANHPSTAPMRVPSFLGKPISVQTLEVLPAVPVMSSLLVRQYHLEGWRLSYYYYSSHIFIFYIYISIHMPSLLSLHIIFSNLFLPLLHHHYYPLLLFNIIYCYPSYYF